MESTQASQTDGSNSVGVDAPILEHIKGQTWSDIWDHFIRFRSDGIYKGKCKYCAKVISADSKNGTKALKNHNSRCKMYAPNAQMRETQTQLNFQAGSIVNDNSSDVGVLGETDGPSNVLWKFDKELTRRALAHMLIVDELPFKHVENEGFLHFCKTALPPSFRVPSRSTITRDCFKLYLDEKAKLKVYFKKNSQRVSLTTDAWTSANQVGYMVVTAHFIDVNWKLHKKILNFVPLSSHKGEAIGVAVEKCLLEWGLDSVFTITVDNASSNDVAVSYLQNQFKNWGNSVCDAKYLHVRCMAHILNLVVCDGIKESKVEIARVRACVRWVRHSPSRIERFKDCVEFEKIEKKSSLILDVSTRWNSTYSMLSVAQHFERAFNRMGIRDPIFKQEMEEGKGWPTQKDWACVRRIVTFLELFYEATLKVSGSLYVTSNAFFQEVLVIEDNLRDLEIEEDKDLVEMAKKMRAKFDKYWGNPEKMNKLLFLAIVLDPRHKMIFVEYGFNLMYGDEKGMLMLNGVKQALVELFTFYQGKHASQNSSRVGASSFQSGNESRSGSGLASGSETSYDGPRQRQRRRISDRFQEHLQEVQGNEDRSELDKYLGEPNEQKCNNFNLLGWWKQNAPRLPILSMMARDILAIPISTVASESAFSTGGRVLDPFRSSLTPRIVQALICAQDWLRKRKEPIDLEESFEALEQMEKEFSDSSDGDSCILDN